VREGESYEQKRREPGALHKTREERKQRREGKTAEARAMQA
jgi:hypothetical protein